MPDRIVEVDPADEYDTSRLYGEEKYKLTNMLIRQVDFPAQAKLSELGNVWTDRIYDACSKAYDEVVEPSTAQKGGGDACLWHRGCPREEFLAYAQILVNAIYKENPPKVTGARMVRNTNVSSGYPVFLWNFYYGSEHTPAAPINFPRRSHKDEMMFEEMVDGKRIIYEGWHPGRRY